MTLKVIAIVAALHLAPMTLPAQTNALWYYPFTTTTNSVLLSDACRAIEKASALEDPTGKGLTILYPRDYTNQTLRFLPTPGDCPCPFTFADALYIIAGLGSETEARIFDRTAVIGYSCYRDTLLALAGRCVDATTGGPITNFAIKAQGKPPRYLTIDATGGFTCAIHYRFDYISTPSASIADHDIYTPDMQVLEFSAPRYSPVVASNSIYWAHRWGSRYLEVKMHSMDD